MERAQGKRVDKVVRALTQTVGNDEKARAAIERVFDSLGDKYKADQLISALEKDVAKIAAVTKAKKESERDVEDQSENYLNQVQATLEKSGEIPATKATT